MQFKRIISIHPKFAAVLDALVGVILLAFTGRFDTFWFVVSWCLMRFGWWVLLTQSVYCPPSFSRIKHFVALCAGNFGFTVFFLLLDWTVAWWIIAVLFVGLPFATFWFIPEKGFDLSFIAKPLRRLKLLLGIVGVAGVCTSVAALSILQIINRATMWQWGFAASVVIGFFSAYWWHEYDIKISRRLVLAALTVTLITGEILYGLLLWPVGYLVSGFVLTWLWYVAWLMARYYLTDQGVNWKRQTRFLIMNGLLLLFYLVLIVRWK